MQVFNTVLSVLDRSNLKDENEPVLRLVRELVLQINIEVTDHYEPSEETEEIVQKLERELQIWDKLADIEASEIEAKDDEAKDDEVVLIEIEVELDDDSDDDDDEDEDEGIDDDDEVDYDDEDDEADDDDAPER